MVPTFKASQSTQTWLSHRLIGNTSVCRLTWRKKMFKTKSSVLWWIVCWQDSINKCTDAERALPHAHTVESTVNIPEPTYPHMDVCPKCVCVCPCGPICATLLPPRCSQFLLLSQFNSAIQQVKRGLLIFKHRARDNETNRERERQQHIVEINNNYYSLIIIVQKHTAKQKKHSVKWAAVITSLETN